jgi:hypothetical protein
MANLRTRSLIVVLGGALCATSACGSDEPMFVTMQQRTLTADGWQTGGSGCMLISFGDEVGPSSGSSVEGSAGVGASIDGGLPPAQLSVARSSTSQGLRVVVTSESRVLAARLLPTKFLETGEIDRFEVTTRDGARHEFAHRGAVDCETGVDLFAE